MALDKLKEMVTTFTEDEAQQVINFVISLRKSKTNEIDEEIQTSISSTEFDEMMANGLAQAKAGQGRPVSEVRSDLRRKIREWQNECVSG